MGVYIPKEDVEYARQVSILEFLSKARPLMYENLQRVGSQYVVKARYYGTKGRYSSFLIRASDGQWWHHSKGTHGKNALDYLIKEEGMDFQSAVFELLGRSEEYYRNLQQNGRIRTQFAEEVIPDGVLPSPPIKQAHPESRKYSESNAFFEEPKELVIPEKDTDTSVLYEYLTGRGISPVVIDHFVAEGSLYQGKKYKNVCFVGYDREDNPRLINQRATKGSFKGNSTGSDRRYSFMLHADSGRSDLHVFEAPLDMLSYACLLQDSGYDFRQFNLLSLSGISGTGAGEEVKLPMGMEEYLDRFPETTLVYIHFDNDNPGRVAGQRLQEALEQKGITAIQQYPPTGCKDVNDYLVGMRKLKAARERTSQAEL